MSGDDRVAELSATGYGFDPALGASIVSVTLFGDGDVTVKLASEGVGFQVLETAITEAYRSAWESINSQLVALPSSEWEMYPFQLYRLGGQLISAIGREFVTSFAAPYVTLRIRGDGVIDEFMLSPQVNALPAGEIQTVIAGVFRTAVTELINRYRQLVANYLAPERQQLQYARDHGTQSLADLDAWQQRLDVIETTYRHVTWPIFWLEHTTSSTTTTLTGLDIPEWVFIPVVVPIDPAEHRTTYGDQPVGRILLRNGDQGWGENPEETEVVDQASEYLRLIGDLHVFSGEEPARKFYIRYHSKLLSDHDIVCTASKYDAYLQIIVLTGTVGAIIVDPAR